jgi:hypothetical protein
MERKRNGGVWNGADPIMSAVQGGVRDTACGTGDAYPHLQPVGRRPPPSLARRPAPHLAKSSQLGYSEQP